jgi:hypothetical protein
VVRAIASRSSRDAERDGVAEHLLVERPLRRGPDRHGRGRRRLARDEVEQVPVGYGAAWGRGQQVHDVDGRHGARLRDGELSVGDGTHPR